MPATRKRNRAGTIVATAVAVLSAGAGCAAGSGRGDPAEPALGTVPVVHTDADIVLPLDASMPTVDDQRTVTAALDLLGRACMRRFGLDWAGTPPGQRPTGPVNVRRYTILDADKVAVEGYHPIDMINEQKDILARQASRPQIPTTTMNVWLGNGESTHEGQPVPDGGCAAEADRRLHAGITPVDAGLPRRLQLESFSRMRTDSRVRRAFAAWSTCMSGRGYHYRDPLVAFDDQRWLQAETGPQEIATAVADVDCKTRGNVGGIMLAVETAYQQRLIKQHRAQLAAAKRYVDAELASARQALSS